jgi:hypothetical protein
VDFCVHSRPLRCGLAVHKSRPCDRPKRVNSPRGTGELIVIGCRAATELAAAARLGSGPPGGPGCRVSAVRGFGNPFEPRVFD